MPHSVFLEFEKLKNLRSGLGQVCLRLGHALVRENRRAGAGFDLRFYVPSRHVGIFGDEQAHLPESKVHRVLPWLLPRCDLWHGLHQETDVLPSRRGTPFVLTIHDLNFLVEKKSPGRRRRRLRAVQRRLDRADAVTVISGHTERVVRENLRIPDDLPVRRIYNGVELGEFPGASRPGFVPPGAFLFSIGIILPKKNFHLLPDLLARIESPRHLVIAGRKEHPYAREIEERARSLGLEERVILPGEVTEEEKVWLYRNCEAFLFPSRAEGFGLPVIEAMTQGKPVFLSREASLPEIGGPEAFYWPRLDTGTLARVFRQGMEAYREDPGKADRIRDWAGRFTWERAAREYLDLYRDVLKRGAP